MISLRLRPPSSVLRLPSSVLCPAGIFVKAAKRDQESRIRRGFTLENPPHITGADVRTHRPSRRVRIETNGKESKTCESLLGDLS